MISSGGGNLSVGQRQIIALARAIVRQSKLLILDEGESPSRLHEKPVDIANPTPHNSYICNRLRYRRRHPRVAPQGGSQRRDAHHCGAPPTDHHGLGQNCTSSSCCASFSRADFSLPQMVLDAGRIVSGFSRQALSCSEVHSLGRVWRAKRASEKHKRLPVLLGQRKR